MTMVRIGRSKKSDIQRTIGDRIIRVNSFFIVLRLRVILLG